MGIRLLLAHITLAFLFLSPADAEAFQAMRLMGGLHTISGATHVAAACLEPKQSVPRNSDFFRGSNISLQARAIGPSGPGTWRPASELLEFRGSDEVFSIVATPKIAGATIELRVPTTGVAALGETSELASLAAHSVSAVGPRTALARIDRVQREIQTAFGDQSQMFWRFAEAKQGLEWKLQEGVKNPAAEGSQFLKSFITQFTLDDPSSDTLFARIASHASPTTDIESPSFRKSVERIFKVRLPAPDESVLDDVLRFQGAAAVVDEAFGPASRFASAYRLGFLRSYDESSGTNLGSVAMDFVRLLGSDLGLKSFPEALAATETKTDLLSFVSGQPISAVQAQALARTTGLKFAAPTRAFDDHLLLRAGDDKIMLQSKQGLREASLSDIRAQLKNKHVVVEGTVPESFASFLRQSGVFVFQDPNALLIDAQIRKRQPKFIMATSMSPSEAAHIWEPHNPDPIIRLTQRAASRSGLSAEIARTRSELIQAIAEARDAGRRPIIIAHNAAGRINFPEPLRGCLTEIWP